MAYKNKVYVSFDGDNDIHYYWLMRAWKQNDKTHFNFYDAHDLNAARDSSTEETITHELRDRLLDAKTFVVLIGESTRSLYKFVRWEMEQALSLNLPIIGVNLNGLRFQDTDLCPPIIRDELAVYISFNPAILQHALETWPAKHNSLKQQQKAGPYYYKEESYVELGLGSAKEKLRAADLSQRKARSPKEFFLPRRKSPLQKTR